MAPVTAHSSTSGQDTTGGNTDTKTTTPAATENMFLKLLVAQLQNQDPMSPADGTQFVSQLAQFQQLEQSLNTGQDVTAIRKDLDTLAPASGANQTSKS